MAKSHLLQSYINTLILGQTAWSDYDMFHSCDTVCGSLMAHSKAISDGPVYLPGSSSELIASNIRPLTDETGKTFRPAVPAILIPESIPTNPLQSGKAYRASAPTGDEALSVTCHNPNTSSAYWEVENLVKQEDYLLWENIDKSAGPFSDNILALNWEKQSAEVLNAPERKIKLSGFIDSLSHLCPIRKGWVVIGIQEKYLSPATVQILKRTADKLILDVHCIGTLRIWADSHGKQELRSIPIKKVDRIEIRK